MENLDTILNDDFDVDLDLEVCALPPAALAPARPSSPNRWPPQLVFDLALGLEDYESIGLRHNISASEIDKLYESKLFRREVAAMTRELQESNMIFRSKAKIQAEAYLGHIHELMDDPDTAPSVKLQIFQTLAKLGDLEPKEPKGAQIPGVPQGGAMRMVVEWVGGPKDHSPVSHENVIEVN